MELVAAKFVPSCVKISVKRFQIQSRKMQKPPTENGPGDCKCTRFLSFKRSQSFGTSSVVVAAEVDVLLDTADMRRAVCLILFSRARWQLRNKSEGKAFLMV
jgi:hypothetical protein